MAAAGGLSLTPAILEQTARSNATGTVTVSNSTDRKLKITVRRARGARPAMARWPPTVAGRSTARAREHVVVHADAGAKPGQRDAAACSRRRSLYSSIEVVGRPTKKRAGINVVHRLIGSLRFDPTRRRAS